LRKHTRAVRQAHDVDHAVDRFRRGFIVPVGCAAFDRTAQDRAIDHAGDPHVDRVLGAAIDLTGQINAHHVAADEPELG
jgi:hypothetical protein